MLQLFDVSADRTAEYRQNKIGDWEQTMIKTLIIILILVGLIILMLAQQRRFTNKPYRRDFIGDFDLDGDDPDFFDEDEIPEKRIVQKTCPVCKGPVDENAKLCSYCYSKL